MKVYNEFPQRSIEWHEIKWGKIGGTLSAGLLKPTDTIFIDLISQIGEEFEPTDSYESIEMQRGNELEPFAIEYLESYTELKFNKPAWLQNEERLLLGISPDGITDDLKIACEVKCFGRKKHWETLINNEIPLENISQCIHYFTVNDNLEKLYFLAFRPESLKPFIKELNRDSFVNIGTNAKPITVTVTDAVKTCKANEILLSDRIENTLISLKF